MAGVQGGPYPQAEIDEIFRGYEDVWLSQIGYHPDVIIPGVPQAYQQQHEENRIVYVAGFTFACDCKDFLRWANEHGGGAAVEKTVTIVDTTSHCTFRWLITPTPIDALRLANHIHGMTVTMWQPHRDGTEDMSKFKVRSCYSSMESILEPLKSPESIGVPTIHGHPSPPLEDISLHGLALEESTPATSSPRVESPANVQHVASDSNSAEPAIDEEHEQPPATVTSSWANIALTANPDTKIINLHPPLRASAGPRVKPVGTNVPSVVSDENMVDQARVVFLVDMPKNLTTQQVSDAIIEGPLRSIVIRMDETKGSLYAGVIFQFALDAEAFYQVLCKERADSRPGRFNFVVEAIRGDPFPMDFAIKSMGPPTYASRRLTLVKSRLFFMINEAQLRAFLLKHTGVGVAEIQLVWLYNGGNATIVFAEVNDAIKVKAKLDEYSKGTGISDWQAATTWSGLQTTYSKDPCVTPLELKTAMT